MKKIIILSAILLASCTAKIKNSTTQEAPQPPVMSIKAATPAKKAEEIQSFISKINQLTFAGKRSGEGYFSADGSQFIFQTERLDDNPFYQIYKMDLEMGDIERVSNGRGKTTCAWIHPDGQRILYASTHLDPQAQQKQQDEIDFRASGQTRRYSWDYDENYDLFVKQGEQTKRLTSELGYDAEGSYSADGQWIVFSSNRNAYNQHAAAMTQEEKNTFSKDPAFMMDIYIMKADGTNVKQLTTYKGYDGGPFISPDNKKIIWRRFAVDGMTAEIYTMNLDGSDKKQITNTHVMSWAPYYHPSQKYIIYTSNKQGFANFELYIVDTAGQHEPVRVSFMDGFDGLPVFTPTGDELYWTRKKDNNDISQIYRANWDHQAALKALELR
jgi:Tol biopolymer transport system component